MGYYCRMRTYSMLQMKDQADRAVGKKKQEKKNPSKLFSLKCFHHSTDSFPHSLEHTHFTSGKNSSLEGQNQNSSCRSLWRCIHCLNSQQKWQISAFDGLITPLQILKEFASYNEIIHQSLGSYNRKSELSVGQRSKICIRQAGF